MVNVLAWKLRQGTPIKAEVVRLLRFFLNDISRCTVHDRTVRIREFPAANLKLLRVTALTQEVQRVVPMATRRKVKTDGE
jgi:hypothetical protein